MAPGPSTRAKRPTIDFDGHGPDYTARSLDILDQARDRCPVAWSDSYDGFWLVTDFDDVAQVLKDHTLFSAEHDLPEEMTGFPSTGSGFRGATIPEGAVRFVPSEADPPLATDIRRLEVPFFTRRSLAAIEPTIVADVDRAIDEALPSGFLDLAQGLTEPVAMKQALNLVGIPREDWEVFTACSGMWTILPGEPGYPIADIRVAQSRVLQTVTDRRRNPQKDITSALTQGVVLGKPLTDQQIVTILNGLVFAGSHTVAAAAMYGMIWLSDKPEVRKRLLEDPALMANAVEEFIRLATPAPSVARNVVSETAMSEVQIHRSDRVLASLTAANRDPAKFECPHEVRVDRANAADHVAFGGGVHRCTGAPLARVEIRVMFERLFSRISDYSVDHSQIRRLSRIGKLNSYSYVPASFRTQPR